MSTATVPTPSWVSDHKPLLLGVGTVVLLAIVALVAARMLILSPAAETTIAPAAPLELRIPADSEPDLCGSVVRGPC